MTHLDQLEIPGTERDEVPSVEIAAMELRQAELAAAAANERKAGKAEALLFALVGAGIREYKYVDAAGSKWTIVAASRTSVKIKRGH